MELRIKDEYLEYSIGGGGEIPTKLKNINPNKYQFLYDNGYSYMFYIINEIPTIEIEDFFGENNEKKELNNDDINQ